MGLQNCKTVKDLQLQSQYFFQGLDFDINSGKEGADMKEACKLEVRILNITSGSCKVSLIQYTDNTRKVVLKKEGETDTASVDKSSNTIIFNKFLIMKYIFEKEQPIDFVINGSINGRVSTTLASIMGSRKQTLNKPIELIDGDENINLEIKGFTYKIKDSNTYIFKVTTSGKTSLKGIHYEIKYLGTSTRALNNRLYKSEVINPKMLSSINFAPCQIPDLYIAPEKRLEENLIEITIFDSLHNRSLSKYTGPLVNLVDKNTTINLGPANKAFISVEKIKNYTFLDYIRGGMQINLTIGIDFTGSNGDPTKAFSLHYLGAGNNKYEVAINSCGNIVAYYDYDQLFPVFGFGGKFCNNTVSHCYPLNMNPNNPEIQGIDGVLQAYRNILNQTKLSGPTYFHYIIDQVISSVKQDLQDENKMNYNILMILTDGIIDDMDDTIDSLVEASYLPISVIIIGIGDADFSNMDILDADDEPLFDKNGRKADRDLVQFVPFNKFSNNGQLLAQEVLEEIPRQVIEYYQHQKIPPRQPIFNI